MKKTAIIMMIAVTVCAMCAFTSSELEGRWVSDKIKLESADPSQKVEMKCQYTFAGSDKVDACYTLTFDVKYERGMQVSAYFDLTGSGLYRIAEDSLIIALDPATINIDLSEDNVRIINSMRQEDVVARREMSRQFADMLMYTAQGLKVQLSEDADVLTGVTVSGKKLECLSGGRPLKLKRK